MVTVLFTPFALAQSALMGSEMSSREMGHALENPSYSLRGTVTDFHGHPLDGAHITAYELLSGHIVVSAVSLPNGSFEVQGLPGGEYLIRATSGLSQAQKQVAVTTPFVQVELRVPIHRDDGGVQGGDTVSVSQFQVPKKARKLLQEARQAYRDNKRDKALRRTNEALKVFPDFSEALTFRAGFYLQDNQADQARKLAEKAIQDDPTYGLAYIVLGSAYNALTRFDDALRVLGRAFSFTPLSWQGYYESARAHLGKNEFGDALRQVDKAAEHAPRNFTSIYLLRAQACLGLKKYDEAITALEGYLKADPDGSNAQQARSLLKRLQSESNTTAASE
jgi:uncharacterized protein HemY